MRDDKYNFWVDRQIGGCIYRFSSFEIKRCSADDKARHFRTWEDFETQSECIRAWRKICDRAAQFAAISAYQKGALARKQGVVVGDNPYPEKDDNFWNWMQGWLHGAKPTTQQEQSNAVV